MPIFDYECQDCGKIEEKIILDLDANEISCDCGGRAHRIISCSKTSIFTANEDAPWIRSVLDVVDKEATDKATVEFRKNPTRQNYKNWMKANGLRHLEPGEKAMPDKPDMNKFKAEQKDALNKKFARDNAIDRSSVA